MKRLFFTFVTVLMGSFAFANEINIDVDTISIEVENRVENLVEDKITEDSAYCTTTLYGYLTRNETFLFMTNEVQVTYTFHVTGGCERCYLSGAESFTLNCWGRTF